MTSLSQDEARVQLAADIAARRAQREANSAKAMRQARDEAGRFVRVQKVPDFDQDDLVPDPETSMAVPVIACVVLVVVLAAIWVWRMVHG